MTTEQLQARSRQTAMEAERHWWVTKLREAVDGIDDAWVDAPTPHLADLLDALESLIAERTR